MVHYEGYTKLRVSHPDVSADAVARAQYLAAVFTPQARDPLANTISALAG